MRKKGVFCMFSVGVEICEINKVWRVAHSIFFWNQYSSRNAKFTTSQALTSTNWQVNKAQYVRLSFKI